MTRIGLISDTHNYLDVAYLSLLLRARVKLAITNKLVMLNLIQHLVMFKHQLKASQLQGFLMCKQFIQIVYDAL